MNGLLTETGYDTPADSSCLDCIWSIITDYLCCCCFQEPTMPGDETFFN